jgi:hypothetical protein
MRDLFGFVFFMSNLSTILRILLTVFMELVETGRISHSSIGFIVILFGIYEEYDWLPHQRLNFNQN